MEQAILLARNHGLPPRCIMQATDVMRKQVGACRLLLPAPVISFSWGEEFQQKVKLAGFWKLDEVECNDKLCKAVTLKMKIDFHCYSYEILLDL